MSTDIPLEVIFEILLLLPVLTLLRFRAVSRKWRALIDSITFQKSHFSHHSARARANDSLVISYTKFGIELYYSLMSPPHKKIRYPVSTSDFTYGLAPCNGVLCVITVKHGAFLWNPFIKKHLRVSHPPGQPYCDPFGGNHGLWSFCNLDDDYKLVRILRFGEGLDRMGRYPVWVYSVKLGFWKSIGDSPYSLSLASSPGAFIGGALHFTGRRTLFGPEFIFALHLRTLEYNVVPLPDSFKCMEEQPGNWGILFRVLDGRIFVRLFSYKSAVFELWVMKEYGVKESWTRLITSTYPCRSLKPFKYVENGKKFLFIDLSKSLVEYDFETRLCQKVVHGFVPRQYFPFFYTPSLLFPPQSGVCALTPH